MSRVGKLAITVPAGVTVTVTPKNDVTVKGPKGTLEFSFHHDMKIATAKNEVSVTRPSDSLKHRALHGTTRT